MVPCPKAEVWQRRFLVLGVGVSVAKMLACPRCRGKCVAKMVPRPR